MAYFKKHWSSELQVDVEKCVEEVVCQQQIHLFLFVLTDFLFLVQGTVVGIAWPTNREIVNEAAAAEEKTHLSPSRA